MDTLYSATASYNEGTSGTKNTNSTSNFIAPRPGLLKKVAQVLGSKATKALAGAVFFGGLAAMPLIGPVAIPILAGSLLLFSAATAASLANRAPEESAESSLAESLTFFFTLPAVIIWLALLPISIPVYLLHKHCCQTF